MIGFFKDLKCKLFGRIYPLKKLPTEPYLKELFPDMTEEEGAYVADVSKPCVRCGKMRRIK